MLERFDVEGRDNRNETFVKFAADHRLRYQLVAESLCHLWYRDTTTPPVIVDAACGTGYGYEYLSPLGHYIGLDYDPGTVAACRRRYPEGDFRVADLQDPYVLADLGRVHAVVSLETAEHLPDPRVFLRAARRALGETGGLLRFSVPTCWTRDFDPYHLRDWSVADWQRLLGEAGFVVGYKYSTGFSASARSFFRCVPTTLRQKLSVVRFLLTRPHYLAARLWQWGLLGTFTWQSTLFVCAQVPVRRAVAEPQLAEATA